MTERVICGDAHAYVDNKLSPSKRREFEALISGDSVLRRHVDLWSAQNEAIRLAFGSPGRSRTPLLLARSSNENSAHRAPLEILPRRGAAAGRAASSPGRSVAPAHPVASEDLKRPPAISTWTRGRIAMACLALGMICVSPFDGPADPRDALVEVGAAAYRAFGGASSASLDFASEDPTAVARWLTPRFLHNPHSGDFSIAGWKLIGVRVVSGVASTGALILYQDFAGERAGVLVEPLDAPRNSERLLRSVGPVVLAAETQDGTGMVAMGPTASFAETVTRAWRGSVSRR